MTAPLDLEPATRQMAQLLAGVRDDQLAAPTPCPDYTLGDLIDHVGGLADAFTRAARKEVPQGDTQGPSGDAGRLGTDWRTRIDDQLAALASAWRAPEAWAGMTRAGGVDLPGEVAGIVALNEVVVHGWDVAKASGQPFECDPAALAACLEFVAQSAAENPEGSEGLFGPAFEVRADAPMVDKVIGLAGRDPAWPAR